MRTNENATILTPPSTSLSGILLMVTYADPGIFVWGGPGQSDKKGSDNVFFSPQLILQKSKMVNFKEIYHFSRFQSGSNFFRGGGGGGGGSNCFFPLETHITCDFPGGSGPPVPPSGSALGSPIMKDQNMKKYQQFMDATQHRYNDSCCDL